jgi:hypothetical protein
MARAVKQLLALLCLVAVAVAASGLIAASAQTTPPVELSANGVGRVTLGSRYRKLHRRHLVKKIRRGCELGGPRTRSAPLVAPPRGSVSFTLKTPRRVTAITITGGATARGAGIGSTIAEIQAAFPGAIVDHGTEQVFGLTLVRVPKAAGGRIQFGVDVGSGRATVIGVPFIAFCE